MLNVERQQPTPTSPRSEPTNRVCWYRYRYYIDREPGTDDGTRNRQRHRRNKQFRRCALDKSTVKITPQTRDRLELPQWAKYKCAEDKIIYNKLIAETKVAIKEHKQATWHNFITNIKMDIRSKGQGRIDGKLLRTPVHKRRRKSNGASQHNYEHSTQLMILFLCYSFQKKTSKTD